MSHIFFHQFSTHRRTQVDLVKGFPTHFWSQKSASIQPRTDWLKFEIEKMVPRWRKGFVRVTNRIDANIADDSFSLVSKPIFAVQDHLK